MDRRDFLAVQHARGRDRGDGDFEPPGARADHGRGEPGVNLDRPNTPMKAASSTASSRSSICSISNPRRRRSCRPAASATSPAAPAPTGRGARTPKRSAACNIEPLALSGVAKVDLTTEILGSKLSMPIFIPPMGSHGLAHVEKEAATAKGAAAVGTLMTTSTVSNLSLEEIASHNPGPKWFQLYVPTDRGYTRELLQRAKAAGYTAIAPTVDNVWSYPREENIRNGFRPPSTLGRATCPAAWIRDTGAQDAQRPQARPRLERPGMDQAGIRPGRDAQGRAVREGGSDGGQGRPGRRLGLQPRRPRLRRRAGDHHRAAAHRTGGRRPRPDRLRLGRAARRSRVQGAGARRQPWSAAAGRSCTASRSAARRACRACSSICATT